MTRTAFLFPGKDPGRRMGKSFYEHSEAARALFGRADDASAIPSRSSASRAGGRAQAHPEHAAGPAPRELCGFRPLRSPARDRRRAQPWRIFGPRRGRRARLRGRPAARSQARPYMQEAVPWARARWPRSWARPRRPGADLARVSRSLQIANWNSPEQFVLAGTKRRSRRRWRSPSRRGRSCCRERPVPFSLMKPAEDRLAVDLDATAFKDLAFPVGPTSTPGSSDGRRSA